MVTSPPPTRARKHKPPRAGGQARPHGTGKCGYFRHCAYLHHLHLLRHNTRPHRLAELRENGVGADDGWILEPVTVTFYEGESVFNVLLCTCNQNGIHIEFENMPIYNSAYIVFFRAAVPQGMVAPYQRQSVRFRSGNRNSYLWRHNEPILGAYVGAGTQLEDAHGVLCFRLSNGLRLRHGYGSVPVGRRRANTGKAQPN